MDVGKEAAAGVIPLWETEVAARRYTFPQCRWGCPAKKMTTITGNMEQLNEFILPCTHQRHEAELSGVDETGAFRTRVAQAYPKELCKKLAECHVQYMLTQRQRPPVELSRRCWENLALQQMERRLADCGPQEQLPASFAAAAG